MHLDDRPAAARKSTSSRLRDRTVQFRSLRLSQSYSRSYGRIGRDLASPIVPRTAPRQESERRHARTPCCENTIGQPNPCAAGTAVAATCRPPADLERRRRRRRDAVPSGQDVLSGIQPEQARDRRVLRKDRRVDDPALAGSAPESRALSRWMAKCLSSTSTTAATLACSAKRVAVLQPNRSLPAALNCRHFLDAPFFAEQVVLA